MEGDVLGVLVTHGSLGAELLRTAEEILGRQSDFICISNRDASLEGLLVQIGEVIQGHPDTRIVLFVDLLGGSCGHACQEMRRRFPRTLVFTGVNLPMLLEFLYHRGRVPAEELTARLIQKGRDGIQLLP